jgi:ribosomal protein S18 acetylase RimI-like enzyme
MESTKLHVEEVTHNRERFMDLLLLADPSQTMVMSYLERGYLFALYEQNEAYAVIHLDPRSEEMVEIKNIAVKEGAQGRGYGKQLMHYAIEYCRHHGYKRVIVGTGNSSIGNFVFYQKMGFRFKEIIRDFFTDHYDEPIFENGIQCRDMVVLEMVL